MTLTATEIKPEPKRDRHGRYLIPGPDGKASAYTRATTVAGTVEDTYNLTRWGKRQVALGMGKRPDLVALAASSSVDDRNQLDSIVDNAEAAAESDKGANLGTALHRFTELAELGLPYTAPAALQPDVDAYMACLAEHGLELVAPEWCEAVVYDPAVQVAGTIDRRWRLTKDLTTDAGWELPAGTEVIGDLKTARNVDYIWMKTAIQLAFYAMAPMCFDVANGQVCETKAIDDVDQTHALVVHLPVGKADANLHFVSLTDGRDLFFTSLEVREARNAAKRKNSYSSIVPKTAGPLSATDAAAPVAGPPAQASVVTPQPTTGAVSLLSAPSTRMIVSDVGPDQGPEVLGRFHGWLLERGQQIEAAGAMPALAARWPPDIPNISAADWDACHTLEDLISSIEAAYGLPFVPGDPRVRHDVGTGRLASWAGIAS